MSQDPFRPKRPGQGQEVQTGGCHDTPCLHYNASCSGLIIQGQVRCHHGNAHFPEEAVPRSPVPAQCTDSVRHRHERMNKLRSE